jgi:hypothetical protein
VGLYSALRTAQFDFVAVDYQPNSADPKTMKRLTIREAAKFIRMTR